MVSKSKFKKVYICSNCAYEASHWVGQCPQCEAWNTFNEDVSVKTSASNVPPAKIIRLSEVMSKPIVRLSTNISEFDRVLGGGLVPGQVILLSGEPGIGKSTVLTEIARKLGKNNVLYVCGEESVEQIKLRALRMGYAAENLLMLQENRLEVIEQQLLSATDLSLVIVDSIQTVVSQDYSGIAGSISQIKGCTQVLTNAAKTSGVPLILVGHVTKEGDIAGPKLLEHVVDTVLHLEGDSQHLHRLLRTLKNRFGPISEVGIFEMTEAGLEEVTNPSKMFLDQRVEKSSGSCVTVVMEGYRPILFEIQALTVKTSFGYPRRTTSGYNNNRLQVLIAILEKRCHLDLSTSDVYLNVAGGFKIAEYAADLAVCLAIASSVKNKPVPSDVAAFGECGLNGEVRKVSHQEKRAKEAQKLGYKTVISADKITSIPETIKRVFGV